MFSTNIEGIIRQIRLIRYTINVAVFLVPHENHSKDVAFRRINGNIERTTVFYPSSRKSVRDAD